MYQGILNTLALCQISWEFMQNPSRHNEMYLNVMVIHTS